MTETACAFQKAVELVIGAAELTIPKFVEEQPGLQISVLHLDVDMYKPWWRSSISSLGWSLEA